MGFHCYGKGPFIWAGVGGGWAVGRREGVNFQEEVERFPASKVRSSLTLDGQLWLCGGRRGGASSFLSEDPDPNIWEERKKGSLYPEAPMLELQLDTSLRAGTGPRHLELVDTCAHHVTRKSGWTQGSIHFNPTAPGKSRAAMASPLLDTGLREGGASSQGNGGVLTLCIWTGWG